MINISLLDDDSILQEYTEKIIRETLNNHNLEFSLNKFKSAEELLLYTNNQVIDILILDIQLPGMDGLDLAKSLWEINKETIIIFLSSFDSFMKEAFGLNVYRYILKSELEEVLPITLIQLINLMNKNKVKKHIFKSYNKEIIVNERDIVYIMFQGRNLSLFTVHEIVRLSSNITIKEIILNLDKSIFVLPNSGTIVNLKFIDQISNNLIKMKVLNTDIPISRGRHKDIYDRHIKFLLNGETL